MYPDPSLHGPEARVTQNFGVPPAQVYSAWLDPQLIGQWMFGPQLRDEEILHLETDPHVGGHFSFRVRRNGEDIDHVGEYLEMEAPNHLVFTWGVAGTPEVSTVNVDIESIPEGSQLTLRHTLDPDWANYIPRMEDSWRKMLQQQALTLAGPA